MGIGKPFWSGSGTLPDAYSTPAQTGLISQSMSPTQAPEQSAVLPGQPKSTFQGGIQMPDGRSLSDVEFLSERGVPQEFIDASRNWGHAGGMFDLAKSNPNMLAATWDAFKDYSPLKSGELSYQDLPAFHGEYARAVSRARITGDEYNRQLKEMNDPRFIKEAKDALSRLRGAGRPSGFGGKTPQVLPMQPVQQPVQQNQVNSQAAGRLGTRNGVSPVGLMSNKLARN